jgi:alkanesulfonate monooxygenase SsuD/methylene tetrahydromethanopterin reductase-like flavin-dependent oxidoreductase (luciferase family)
VSIGPDTFGSWVVPDPAGMAIDIQISPANCSWPELGDAALAAEQAGFAALWTFDHLAGVALGGTTMLECFTLLGALAQRTSTIELGTLVANVWNREPGTLVTAAASVALISGRRFHLGLGAGTSPGSRWAFEQHAVGRPLAASIEDRHQRLEHVLDLTEAEWRPDPDDQYRTFPVPPIPPTRIIGVNSVRLSQLAGRRADGINMPWHHPRRDEFMAAAAAAAGGRGLLQTVWSYYDPAILDPEHPERQAMRAAGIDRLILAELGPPNVSGRR